MDYSYEQYTDIRDKYLPYVYPEKNYEIGYYVGLTNFLNKIYLGYNNVIGILLNDSEFNEIPKLRFIREIYSKLNQLDIDTIYTQMGHNDEGVYMWQINDLIANACYLSGNNRFPFKLNNCRDDIIYLVKNYRDYYEEEFPDEE